MIPIRVANPNNPFRDHVQGKANEPITVAALLDRAYQFHGTKTDCTLEAVFDRLDANAPRIAIIGGSTRPPGACHGLGHAAAGGRAHLGERTACPSTSPCPWCATAPRRATSVCLTRSSRVMPSRRWSANQMEGQSYHGAFRDTGLRQDPDGDRLGAGPPRPCAHRARAMRRCMPPSRPRTCSRAAAYPLKWWRRYAPLGGEGPRGRASGPRRGPRRQPATTSCSAPPTRRFRRCSSAPAGRGYSPRSAQGAGEEARGQHLRREGRHLRLPRHRQLVARRGGGVRPCAPVRGATHRAAHTEPR